MRLPLRPSRPDPRAQRYVSIDAVVAAGPYHDPKRKREIPARTSTALDCLFETLRLADAARAHSYKYRDLLHAGPSSISNSSQPKHQNEISLSSSSLGVVSSIPEGPDLLPSTVSVQFSNFVAVVTIPSLFPLSRLNSFLTMPH